MTETVNDGNRNVGKLALHLIDDFGDLLLGHRSVGIVENRLHRFALVVIANDAFEQHICAVGGTHDALHQSRGVDRIVSQVGDGYLRCPRTWGGRGSAETISTPASPRRPAPPRRAFSIVIRKPNA